MKKRKNKKFKTIDPTGAFVCDAYSSLFSAMDREILKEYALRQENLSSGSQTATEAIHDAPRSPRVRSPKK